MVVVNIIIMAMVLMLICFAYRMSVIMTLAHDKTMMKTTVFTMMVMVVLVVIMMMVLIMILLAGVYYDYDDDRFHNENQL